ncbi:DUF2878 domain-containing protein [Thiohalocapsa marina]|uniref:DUF2878 domain-containing protein n=1 Tax=Thiohalocapsa marina TaxID=424902 RepID=UPI001FEA6B8D|nr:DUF2878 domain-containing protein [Thiohalocapsa marina]
MTILINFLLFQASWLACVLSGAHGWPLLGIAVVAIVVGYHLVRAHRPWAEAALLALAGAIGAFWDGQLVGHGWLIYPSGVFAQWLAPSWIIAMWVAFATTLNVSLRWLRGRAGWALLFGAIGAPLAYYAGARLGGVQFADPLIALLAVAAGWMLITPVLVALAGRLDGFRPAATPANAEPRPSIEVREHV